MVSDYAVARSSTVATRLSRYCAIQGAGEAQAGARPGLAVGRRRVRRGMVRGRAPLPRPLRGSQKHRSLLPSRHGALRAACGSRKQNFLTRSCSTASRIASWGRSCSGRRKRRAPGVAPPEMLSDNVDCTTRVYGAMTTYGAQVGAGLKGYYSSTDATRYGKMMAIAGG
uniref:Uncharacterized protein n=1 Tax=Oryza meridionalis TaxID=40149 RepID=A0A0E0BWE0_9ORYZ